MSYYSRSYFTAEAGQTDFPVDFEYLDRSHVKVYVNGDLTTAWTWINATNLRLTTGASLDDVVLIKRETSPASRLVDYVSPSSLNEDDLDTDSLQGFYLAQEANDQANAGIADDPVTGQYTANNKRVANLADPVNNQDAVTKLWATTAMSSQLAVATTKATEASASAAAAAASASTASAAASTATTKAGEAATSASSASASASTATTKAGEASTSASNAATSASNAASSASTATTKASEASTSASGAASSASTATTKAAEAETARAAAVVAKDAAEAAAAGLTPVQEQINAATDTAFADSDMLTARKNSDGTLIKRSFGNVRSAIQTAFSSVFQPLNALLTSVSGLAVVAGDLVYGTGANAVGRLAIGSTGSVLTVAGGVPTWAAAGGGTEIGVIEDYAGHTVPAKWLLCFGQNVSRTTYSALFAALCKQSTVTITIASPGVVTWTAHGLKVGDPVSFTTTGALPTGIVAGTTYFVQAVPTADTLRLSATFGGAVINTSGSQSGVHTALYAPFGRGDGSTTFGLPDARGRVSAGRDDMGGTSANRLTGLSGGLDGDFMGNSGGAETHTLTTAQLASHTHTYGIWSTGGGAAQPVTGNAGSVTNYTSGSAGSDQAHNNVQPTFIVNKMIYAGV